MNYGKSQAKRLAKSYDPKGIKIRNKFSVILCKVILVVVVIAGLFGLSSGIGVMKGIIDSAPDISAIDVTPTGYQTIVYANDETTEIATLVASGSNRKYVTINEIPESLQHAFVAIEDERFYEHNGIDPQGIIRAGVSGLSRGLHFDQGASTITQQLIKNNVLTTWTSETSMIEKVQRKIQEQYLALEIEKKVNNKDWILENYMNSINLGANTLGVQAASTKYFGKDVSELTLSESAVIAGITQNPTKFNPITHPEENTKRRAKVLKNMFEQEYITQAEYDEALADDVYSRIAEHNQDTTQSVNSYYVDALIDDVYDDLIDLGYSETEAYKMIYQGGLQIYSNQDLAMQSICDEEVNNTSNYPGETEYSFQLAFQVKRADGTVENFSNQTMLSYYKKATGNQDYSINFPNEDRCYEAIAAYEQEMLGAGDSIVEGSESINITLEPEVALTVIDQTTGAVKAIVGGRGEKVGNRTWNRATDTCRQPGSTFKIIGCYAAALDAGGLTLASVQDDSPFTVGSKTFHNYDNIYRGYTNIRTAITYSINIVTVKTLQQIGADLAYQYAEDFGITTLTEDDKNLSLSLGGLTRGVTNLELTGAYATIANAGTYLEPKFYSKVLDHEGNVLLDMTTAQDSHEVISPQSAWLLTDAMKDVVTQGTGTRAYFGGSMAQAGKSGTTTSNRDALWAGYTPYYTCVVWGGYDDNSKQSGSKTSYPKNIWKAVMGRIHEGLEYKDFERPSGITSASVCKKSGLKPLDDVCSLSGTVYTEYFANGTVPSSACNNHTAVDVCADSGMIAGLYCPNVTKSTFIVNGNGASQDGENAYNPDMLNNVCTMHTAENMMIMPDGSKVPIEVPQVPNTTDIPGTTPGTVDPNGGDTTGGNSSGNNNGGAGDNNNGNTNNGDANNTTPSGEASQQQNSPHSASN